MRTAITAHRGFSARYPENTLLAFHQAILAGADRIELDVHYSADHRLVVHHDYSFAHMGYPDTLIFETPSELIRTFTVGGEPVPFLDEVFADVGPQVDYEVELKGFTDEFLSAVLDVVKRHGLLPRIEFTSPHPFLLAQLRAREPAAKTGLFVMSFPSWMSEALGVTLLLSNLTLGRFNVAHCPLALLNRSLVDTLHAHHVGVHAADCNVEKDLAQAFMLGVDQLSTDDVTLAQEIREQVQGRA